MIRATEITRRAAVREDRVADTITLDHGDRHRRRIALKADGGLEFLLDLPDAAILDHGDAVKLEDGRLVRIAAAPEKLIEITAGTPLRLMKVAWHLGNRHVPTELKVETLYIAHDHVLLEMIRGLGATAEVVERPFRPERGAYAEGHGGHDHGHAHHGHDHAHGHEHAHHDHGPNCGCGHSHG